MSTPDLTPEALAARYSLLCRATCPPDADNPAQRELNALQNLIEQQLPALARHYCPPGFADTWLGLKAELQRLREFCACPALAHKTLIAFGGGFSAGKSSLINALIGEKRLLPAQVDPTTSLPTYLLHGPAHAIHALNQYRRLIELSPEEFASLTHDEQARFGSSAARLLEATYLTHPSFAWQNLAFIDTPGYSKPDDANASRSDAQLARAWLNSAHAIVWAVSAEAGCISEDDLAFLATLNPDIPRVVVVTKADKKTEKDVADISELIKKTMAERNLPARKILVVSARKKDFAEMNEFLLWLKRQNRPPVKSCISIHIDNLFTPLAKTARQTREAYCQNIEISRISSNFILSNETSAKHLLAINRKQLSSHEKFLKELLELAESMRPHFNRAIEYATGQKEALPSHDKLPGKHRTIRVDVRKKKSSSAGHDSPQHESWDEVMHWAEHNQTDGHSSSETGKRIRVPLAKKTRENAGKKISSKQRQIKSQEEELSLMEHERKTLLNIAKGIGINLAGLGCYFDF